MHHIHIHHHLLRLLDAPSRHLLELHLLLLLDSLRRHRHLIVLLLLLHPGSLLLLLLKRHRTNLLMLHLLLSLSMLLYQALISHHHGHSRLLRIHWHTVLLLHLLRMWLLWWCLNWGWLWCRVLRARRVVKVVIG